MSSPARTSTWSSSARLTGSWPSTLRTAFVAQDGHAHRRAFRKNDGAVHRKMRGDGDEQDVAQFGRQDGPAGSQGISGGAGGGGGDQPVGHIGGQVLPVHAGFDVDGAQVLLRAPTTASLSACHEPSDFASANVFSAQHHAVFDPEISDSSSRSSIFCQPSFIHLEQEAKPSFVDAQNRNIVGRT